MAGLIVFLLLQPAAGAQAQGVILDPHGAPIPGAAVTVVCREATHALRADEAGEFTVPRSAGAGCVVRVSQPGFVPVERPLITSRRRLAVVLAIAPVVEDVRVESAPVLAAAAGLDALWLDERSLRRFGTDPARMLEQAALRAGAGDLDGTFVVDGVPGRSLPAGIVIAGIAINRDVFSAAYAEPDRPQIEITTRAPARRASVRLGGTALGAGGRNPLARTFDPRADRIGLQLTAPVPGLPLSMAFDLHRQRDRRGRAVAAATEPEDAVPIVADSSRVAASLHYDRASSRFLISALQEHRGADGIAGDELASSESATRSASRRREMTILGELAGRRARHHVSFLFTDRRYTDRAVADLPGVTIRGVSYTGGAPVSRTAVGETTWRMRVVSRSPASETWLAGASVTRTGSRLVSTPNPFGVRHLPSDVLHLGRGVTSLEQVVWNAALFADRAWRLGGRGSVKAGVRLDRQSGHAAAVSPRLSAHVQAAGFVLRAGAAMFARPIPAATLLAAGAGDGTDGERFVGGAPVQRAVAEPLARPMAVMGRASVEKRIAGIAAGLEFWTVRGRRELGERRTGGGQGWLDLLESNRRSREDRWRLRLVAGSARHQLTAHYVFTRAFDEGAGPAPAWARAAGVPRHALRAAMDLTLPLGIAASVTAVLQSGAPYDVTLVEDTNGDGLYADRGAAGRNSGLTPPMRTVAIGLHRRVPLPRAVMRLRALDVGIDARNVFDDLHVLTVGAIAGASSAGRVLSAAPGRSIRAWATFR